MQQELRPVLLTLGLLLVGLAAAMLLPLAVDAFAEDSDWGAFAGSAAFTVFVGAALVLANRGEHGRLTLRQGFLLTTATWVVVSAFSALPFVFSDASLGYADAFFEAVSGLTTTGSTVLTDLDHMHRGILLWRSLLQGLGGIGIIVTAVALLPFLGIGGMQLFRMESSDRSEKFLPRPRQVAGSIGIAYATLCTSCILVFWAGGMSFFDAFTHAFPTVSTGGFANYDASFAAFDNPVLHWSATFFMMAGGLPTVLVARLLSGHPRDLLRASQVRSYVMFLAVASVLMAAWLVARGVYPDPFVALRHAAFNVVSIVTTTGFSSTDYTQWGPLPVLAMFVLTFVGACTGSTAGGIKIFRFEVIAILLRTTLVRATRPSAVLPRSYDGRAITPEVAESVLIFFFIFIASTMLTALLLAATGLDLETSLSGAVTALANVGPGLGPVIGPAGNFAPLSDAAKWVLAFAMLLGRLEFMTMLVLCVPRVWRR